MAVAANAIPTAWPIWSLSIRRAAAGIWRPTSTKRLPLTTKVERSQKANACTRERARITRGPDVR